MRHLVSTNPLLCFSISATTRPKREGEVDGKDYYFLELEDFKARMANGEFVEYEEVYSGTFYGTLRSEIDRIWISGQHVLFDIDVVGALNLKKMYETKALSIIVMPPSIDQLKERLIKRGSETEESLKKRIGKAERELAQATLFDRRIVNDKLKESLQEAQTLVDEFLNG